MANSEKDLKLEVKSASKEGNVRKLKVAIRSLATYHKPLSHQSIRYYARQHNREMVMRHTNGGQLYYTLR